MTYEKAIYSLLTTAILSFIHTGCNSAYIVQKQAIEIDGEYVSAPEIETLIIPYKEKIEEYINSTISISEQAMTKGQPESLLGNLMADLTYEQTKDSLHVDMIVLNTGGIRANLPKGVIRVKDAYQIMPFENEIVALTLAPEQMKALIDYLQSTGGQPISNASFSFKKNGEHSIAINNKSYDSTKEYTIVTTDYLANGGDNMDFLKNATKRVKLHVKFREMMILYFKKMYTNNTNINSNLDGRIQFN